jgi:signal transduction histidine kinase/ligand-binding sensor domain-containing protein
VTLFHGLPSDQVRAVAQDADGVMWFGTDAGLARYDGRRVQSVTSEGLSGPRVRALRVDAGGALWVGADGGAYVRAAGAQTFRHVAETKGKSVMAVVTPAPGRALLATADGLVFECRLEADGSLTVRQLGEPLTTASGKSQPVQPTSLALLGETLVVGTSGRGLMTIEPSGETKEVVGRPRTFYVESLERGADGSLFIGAQTSGGDSGIFRVDDAKLARPLKVSGGATGTVSALAVAPGGDLYAATDGRGVFRYRSDGQPLEHFTFAGTAGGLRSDRVNAVFVDREGVVWFGTPRGVCRYDPRGVRVEQLSSETESNFVRALYRTSRGRLLVGTSRGLFAQGERGGAWREVEEVAGKTVYALAEDSRGLLLVGTGAGLFVGLQAEGRAPRRAVRLAPEEKAAEGESKVQSPKSKVRGIAAREASEKVAGAGTGSEGNTESPEAGAEKNVESGAAGNAGASVSNESEPGAAESAAKKAAAPALSGSVRAIARFGDAVYVATYGRGLERFDGPGRRALVWPRQGEDERGREVVSLFADEQRGRLWIGTANAGIFYFDGDAVKSEAALDSLSGSTVWGASAADGWLWLATGKGLYAFREGRALVEVAHGVDARGVVAVRSGDSRGASSESVPQAWCATAGAGVLKAALDEQFGAIASQLNTEQGLPTENAFAVLPVAADEEDAGGASSLLVGTTRGLARYEPGTLAPVLRLARVTTSRTYQPEELQRGGALRLGYPQNGLTLDVTAGASRTFPEQFQYAFTLRDAGGRTIKQKLSRDSQFQVEGLRAGHYVATARAFTLDLTPSEPLLFEFEVARSPFPRTTVALSVLLALALVALLWAYVQHRKIVRSGKEVREANHQLAAARLQLASEAEAERRRIARDLHDQTLADLRRLLLLTDEMQPGVAATTTTTSGLATTTTTTIVDPAQLRAEIEDISQEVRRICEDLSPSVLENVGFAAALEFALANALAHTPVEQKFAYDFICDEGLEERLHLAPGVQMQVYRIVQEAVSNVCRHAQAARVSLHIHVDDAGDFVLTLEDDGRGFDPGNKKAIATGRGIAGIRARASLIEAEVEWRKRDGAGMVFVLRKKSAGRKEAADTERGTNV